MIRITTHPGIILKYEYLRPLGLSQRALADKLDVPVRSIAAIIRGTQPVTADMAIRFGEAFGNSAELWMNLQQMHDLSAKRQARLKLAEAAPA